MKKLCSIMLIVMLTLSLSVGAFAEPAAVKAPKYVFMFIADGQGAPQITAAEYFLGALNNPDAEMPIPSKLNFSKFSATGIMTTYDATSFCPDSASTATSMASGEKTLSGVVNYDTTKENAFKIITEYAKESGKKVGVVSSVSIDHATPAAYYAKATSRSLYYDIALQAANSSALDFLGGGTFVQPTGKEKDQPDVFEIAAQNGYTIVSTIEGIKALNASSGKVIASVPDIADSGSMLYEIDRLAKVAAGEESLSLVDMTIAAINTIDNPDGFFLMVEGGKVDWTNHGNDAATSIHDTLIFADAVQVAIDFAEAHPDETLIIVTGDHETGGLTIGFATTGYSTHLTYLAGQNISFVMFADTIVSDMRANGATFEDALSQIEAHFGLTATADQPLTLTDDEMYKLKTAYEISMLAENQRELGEAEALAYGGYDPLTMAVTHILNNKAGIAYTSYSHTGLQLPVYAMGVGAETFIGSYDNTDIFSKTMAAMGIAAESSVELAPAA